MQEIIHRYSLIEQLASRQFRATYLGHPVSDDQKRVVIKIFEPEALDQDLDQRSSQAHLHALEQLVHPSICALLNIGIEDGRLYVVSEYCTGGSLRAYLNAIPSKILPWQKALHIVRQVGEALEFAHRRSLLHGGVRPENVLCYGDDVVLLTDFSLTPVVDATRLDYKSDIPAMRYMAPERFRGVLQPESDQYALACLAYELLTGVVPFNEPSFSAMWKKHSSEYVLPPSTLVSDLPELVDQAILKALAKKPGQRYGSVSEFIAALLLALPHTLDQSPTDVTLSAVRVTGDLGLGARRNSAPLSPHSDTFQSFDVLSDDLSFLTREDPVQPPVTPDPSLWKQTPEETGEISQLAFDMIQQDTKADAPVVGRASGALRSADSGVMQQEEQASRVPSNRLPDLVPSFNPQIDDDLLTVAQNVRFSSRPLGENEIAQSEESRRNASSKSTAVTKRFPLPTGHLHSGSFLIGSVFSSIAVLLAIVCIPLALRTPGTVAVMNSSHNTALAPTSQASLGGATLIVLPTQGGHATTSVKATATVAATPGNTTQGNGQPSVSGTVVATPTTSSDKTGTSPTSGAVTPTAVVVPTPTPAPTGTIRINAGGGAVNSFVADTGYDTGSVCQGDVGGVFDTSAITDNAPDTVFRSDRCGSEFTYTITGLTPSHTYTVRLLFAETYWSAAGQRIFDVTINNQLVLTNFDIYATAGATYKGIEEQFLVQPTSSGTIAIYFDRVVDNAQVNGIEVLA